ncbi:MAG: TetR/AcrR family transcriptional regulator [Acidimicrobiaceae bacterium]|nr:TetR/AcrR family transcriptional regulator [Acidimicrobiaceae bacterium]
MTELRSPRERYRAQIRDEIKDVALRQLAELGPGGVSVNAIGKDLGVSGPAVYRYFASRDELLSELVVDAYTDLAASLRSAVANVPGPPARSALETLLRSYRAWAANLPHRYRLLYGPLLPGHDPNAERLVRASQASMELLLAALPPADRAQRIPKGLVAQATSWMQSQGLSADVPTAIRAVQTWSRLHGFVTLEINGNFASMGLDPDALFEIELSSLGR